MVVTVGDRWLAMVSGVGGIWLVKVRGMSHYFFFVFSLLCCNYFQNILSTFFFFFLDENMIIIMTLLGKYSEKGNKNDISFETFRERCHVYIPHL